MKIEKFRKHLQMLHLNVYNTILHLLSQIALWETPKLRDAAAAAAAAAESLQSCLTLCNPIDSSPPDSAIPGIFQARILEWVAIAFSNAWKWKVKSEIEVAQSCPTLRDPMDCSLPGSSVHGIVQARVLEWVAIAFSQLLSSSWQPGQKKGK